VEKSSLSFLINTIISAHFEEGIKNKNHHTNTKTTLEKQNLSRTKTSLQKPLPREIFREKLLYNLTSNIHCKSFEEEKSNQRKENEVFKSRPSFNPSIHPNRGNRISRITSSLYPKSFKLIKIYFVALFCVFSTCLQIYTNLLLQIWHARWDISTTH
ncbi:hypothetical protein KSS87_008905, partial [Heliosperma pusillum]